MYNRIKSIIDLFFAILGLIVLSPFILLVAIIQLLDFKNAFFIQRRPGLNATIFKMIKFRTLKIEGDDSSVTWFGSLLRKTSFDEVPQLINILKGEMSFIGPRPLLVEYLKGYSDRQSKRHNVKPGITGLAQVSGRNKLSWEDSLELDVQYVENISFLMDLKISIKSIFQLFKFSEVDGLNGKNREPFI